METERIINVHLDGQEVVLSGEMTLQNASEEMRKHLDKDRVLTEILVDHQPIDVAEEEKLKARFVSDLGAIEFKSQDVQSLLGESLKLAPQVCEALLLDCQEVDRFFEQENFVAANERIAEISSLVDWLLQMMSSLQSYGDIEFRDFHLSGNTQGREVVEKMDSLLRQLHSHLESENFEEFRKVLGHDFQALVHTWKDLFHQITQVWKTEKLN